MCELKEIPLEDVDLAFKLLSEVSSKNWVSQWSYKVFLETIASSKSLALYDNKSLTSFVIYSYLPIIPEIELLQVVTNAKFLRKGFAGILLSSILKKHSDCEIFLEVHEDNIPAIRLYHKLGFQKQAIRKNYYKADSKNALLLKWSASHKFFVDETI